MIEAKHLTKQYGNHMALEDLSFTVEKGQIYGFLGPNGAGKSTTMNIMTGCLSATSGEVKVGGFDIFEEPEKAKKLIGYLPEQPPLYLNRSPREYLEFVAEAKGISKNEIENQVQYVMSLTQITDVADRLCKNLSKGYKQRVGIAQALLGNPEIIILDEPTVGLDPRQIIEIRELIKSLSENHTVILSSHILSEVQAVCQKIMIISKGKLVACDTPENLEKLFAGTITLDIKAEASEEEAWKIVKNISQTENITIEKADEKISTIKIHALPDNEISLCRSIFFAFSKAGKAILQMSTIKASLEDIFIELTRDEMTNAARTEENTTETDDDADDENFTAQETEEES